ncbi:4Fe-4S ferredoxin iron-sulfur binding domain protein [Candidatus Zixiibacteriota bacterium]|nr:4Fe-4S ferredoxin iron-sulfur binding domain protein [candidate division Zixibacteria bacterium]
MTYSIFCPYFQFMTHSVTKTAIQNLAVQNGAALCGICRIDDELRQDFHFEIRKISEKMTHAISIGVALSKSVMDTLVDRPNMLYKAHYRQVNATLDDIALAVSKEIESAGHRALPLPASMVLKRRPMIAHLSHREIAYRAGLGWRGRNNLLVSKKYGSMVRLVTVLTDFETDPDEISKDDCGECRACLKACPAGAIFEDEERFNLEACSAQVHKFARENNYGLLICGLCLKVCRGKK